MQNSAVLVIRLGAMGDILHALPAAASLKRSFPSAKLAWLVADKWMPLLNGNPYIDELIPFHRGGIGTLRNAWRRLRQLKPAVALDFQGLFQSAIAGRSAQPEAFFGFDRSVAREPFASMFYTHAVPVTGPHRIDRNLQLVQAAGASELTHDSWIPPGEEEGDLPPGPFVLANPFAGWTSKQWPLAYYEPLAQSLRGQGLELVANVSLKHAPLLKEFKSVRVHTSSIAGLIAATRRASAVIGLDSGPLHLAAALRKPGVALFGPTDPVRTGPYGGTMTVLRVPTVETTYKRHSDIHPSMKAITPQQVAGALLSSLSGRPVETEFRAR